MHRIFWIDRVWPAVLCGALILAASAALSAAMALLPGQAAPTGGGSTATGSGPASTRAHGSPTIDVTLPALGSNIDLTPASGEQAATSLRLGALCGLSPRAATSTQSRPPDESPGKGDLGSDCSRRDAGSVSAGAVLWSVPCPAGDRGFTLIKEPSDPNDTSLATGIERPG